MKHKNHIYLEGKHLIIKILFFIIYTFFAPLVFAQDEEGKENLSFLMQELASAEGERKVDILNQLALRIADIEQAKKYADEALKLAQSMDYQDGIATAYIALGESHKYLLHHILPTDSLTGLAQKYATSVESIMQSSQLIDEAVFEGQILKIQTSNTIASAEQFFLKALETRKLQGFPNGQVWALLRLANLFEVNNAMEKAENYYSEIVRVRTTQEQGNDSDLRASLLILGDFYFRRSLLETKPSEKIFFIQKEDEIRDKIAKIKENKPKETLAYLTDLVNTGNFYWFQRKQIHKAEKYFKKAVAIAQARKEHGKMCNSTLWDFYKRQGRIYFSNKDYELSEQFFRNYVQSVANYYAQSDSLAYQEIGNAYLNVADFYKTGNNYIGSEIYTYLAIPYKLKLKSEAQANWLQKRISMVDTKQIVLDSLALLRVRAYYSEDFKNQLAYLPQIPHLPIKQVMLQKIIDLGAILGKPSQMLDFYQLLLKNPATDTESKVNLLLNSISVLENEGNTVEVAKYYQQIINLTEPINPKTNVHYFHLAKSYKALKNKQKAIDYAWKTIRYMPAIQAPNQQTTRYLTNKELQQAKDMLAELMKFDEVTDTTFIVHVVERGETLNHLQQYYDVSMDCLKEWNYIDSNELVEGMKLKVCKKADWIRSKKEQESLPPNTYIFHIVNHGETLGSIAQKYKKTVVEIQSYNNNALSALSVGQRIWVGKFFMQCGCEK
ncbi:MAG: LysM peptidoglycan-binding domain-containing protein [Thermoflexibacter sp.]|nr:LysM peptidoglycan-binding domain-containing protein [Thermoflexibacter sp.]